MYSFKCYGHKNITSSHKNTLEFTKDKELSEMGHCIVGIGANFSSTEIKKLLTKESLKIIIQVGNLTEEINCQTNKEFNDKEEIVIRKSNFLSNRTLGLRCDKASSDLKNELKSKLKNPDQEIIVKIT